ncbi:MAG: UbiD family decarboxylase [Thaumarchaeota archaeon]|nr:UbiD family decarboxylase [Nitrososphaerota archaeon]
MSLRSYLEKADVEVVDEEVSPDLEVADRLRKARKAVLFRKIRGYSGFSIAGNLVFSRSELASLLRVDVNGLAKRLASALSNPTKYRLVGNAPWLEAHHSKPDLASELPLTTFYKQHPKRYASATIVLAKDPESGRQNASIHRLMHLQGNRFAIRIVPRDLYTFYQKNKERGLDTVVVVICGLHPLICLAAATSHPSLDELEFANTLLNGELECFTLDGFNVPKEAEVVMKGRLLHLEEADEGPFVDLTGTWDAVRKQPILEVDELYHRSEPIWQVILPGGVEHRLLMGVPQEPRILAFVENAVPSVQNVVLSEGGCGWLHAVVSIKKMVEGDGKNAGLAALAAHPSLKMVIVVDDDIDIYDPLDVEWALATRFQPDRGLVVLSGVRGSSLDPSSNKSGVTSKWLIDATLPLDADRERFRKVRE